MRGSKPKRAEWRPQECLTRWRRARNYTLLAGHLVGLAVFLSATAPRLGAVAALASMAIALATNERTRAVTDPRTELSPRSVS